MRRAVLCLLCALWLLCMPFVSAFAAERPQVSAQAAALMVLGSGELLYEKNAHTRRSMASTTKIMTALLALEAQTPQREIAVTQEMLCVEGTSMGLAAGDSVTLSALVYGMMLSSGNDAANCAAFTLGGDLPGFAAMMNRRAAQIGMKNSHFVTPSGLDAPEHYSSAYDMALLGCVAMENVQFAKICASPSALVFFGNPPQSYTLYNHNRLLRSYVGSTGIKTGFTKKSGRCLVSAAERDGVTLVAVTLNASNDWEDHRKLLDYGFARVQRIAPENVLDGLHLPIAGSDKESVPLESGIPPFWSAAAPPAELQAEIRLRPFEYAPLPKGKIVGELRYFAKGKLLCAVPVVTAEEARRYIPQPPAPEPEVPGFWARLREKLKVRI